jgi:integrase
MALTLFAPGTRKKRRFWYVRGWHDGQRYEVSTKTPDKAEAQRFLKNLLREIEADRLPRRNEAVTFGAAARLYAEFHGLDLDDPKYGEASRIRKLVGELGKKPVAELRQPDLVAAATRLYPRHSAATKNREALRPAAAILHYAAEAGYCGWLRVKLFKEPRAVTRAVSHDIAAALVAAAPEGAKRLLLVWLFRQGTRISDTLRLRWQDIDLAARTVRVHVHKTDSWLTLPLHDELFEMLAAIPAAERLHRLFPWQQKTGVYKWLRPLVRELGVAFTPHMARHSLGTWLNEAGAGLRTIMAALGHADATSSIRYQAADVEIVRAAAAKLRAPIAGKRLANG